MSTTLPVLSGRYELQELLGAGGMARVYRGVDRVLGRTVAVKVLTVSDPVDDRFVARFRREAQAAARLNHPSVVGVYDSGSDDGTHYIVMEYVQGRTLDEVLRTEARLTPERAAEIAESVAEALSVAHAHGIVHRDIKPANIMITARGEVKVMDFGIARALSAGQTITRTAAILGTASYLSPEQAQGQDVDGRSDLYSLGAVLYEMLTGGPPFTGSSAIAVAAKHIQEKPRAPSQLNPDVPESLDRITLTALAKDPDQRYRSAQEMRTDLRRAHAGPPLVATEPVPPETTGVLRSEPTSVLPAEKRSPRRSFALAAAAVALILAGAAIGVLLSNDRTPTPPAARHRTPPSASPSPRPSPRPSAGAPTFGRASGALLALVTEGVSAGRIDQGAGNDLEKHIQDLVATVSGGKSNDVAHKLSDLESKIAEDIDKGSIEPPYASRIEHAVRVLASTLGSSQAEGD